LLLSAGEVKNDVGIYLHKKCQQSKGVFLFCFEKQRQSASETLLCQRMDSFFQTNHIGHDTCNRTHKQSQREVLVSPVLPDDDDTIINKSELHDLAHQLAGSFWQDKQIFKLFNSSDVEYMLSVCFKKLKVTEFDHSELLTLVNKPTTILWKIIRFIHAVKSNVSVMLTNVLSKIHQMMESVASVASTFCASWY